MMNRVAFYHDFGPAWNFICRHLVDMIGAPTRQPPKEGMSMGAALFNFAITFVGLCIVGYIIFLVLDAMEVDARFKNIAKAAVGGCLALAILMSLGGVFGFGPGGGFTISPVAIIYFAATSIGLLAVWWVVVNWILPAAARFFPPIAPLIDGLKFIISVVILIVLLLAGATLLFGGQLGLASPFRFGDQQRHGSLQGNAAWAAAGQVRTLRGYASIPGADGSTRLAG